MTIRHVLGLAGLTAVLASAGCGWFEDPTPENIRVRLGGAAGTPIQLVLSSQFVAAVDDRGVTQVEIFFADTLQTTLPVDTTLFIGIDRRMFVQVAPLNAAEIQVQARIDVDDRTQVNESGLVRAADPWRYAYLFNQAITRVIDIVI